MKPEPTNTTTIGNKGGKPPVIDPVAVKQELDAIGAKADQALAALANTPDAAEITALKGSIEAVKSSVEGLPYADHATLIKALDERVDELQTGAALLGNKAADQPQGIKMITQEIHDSEIYKSIFDAEGNKAGPVAAAGSWTHPTKIPSYAVAGYKAPAPVVISDMAGGTTTAYRPGIFMDQQWAMNLVSRIPRVVLAGANNYAIPKETLPSRYGAWKSKLAATLTSGDTTIEFDDVDALKVGSVVRFWSATDTLLGSEVVISINTTTKVVTFAAASLLWNGTIGWKVTSENYAVTAELGTKGSGFVGTANVEFALKMLAAIVPTTVNALNTIQGLGAMIESKLPERHNRNLSQHLLYGDDGAGQLQGLRTYTGAQSSLWSSGVSGDNQIDAVMRAANLIPWTSGIGVIMSQQDLPALFLLKGSDGHYLRTGNFGMVPLSMIGQSWFLGPYELVFDYAVTSGDFTVINWADASEIADQNTASLMWGYINDDFSQNIIRARYEATLAHAIKSTQAYVVGEWDAAP